MATCDDEECPGCRGTGRISYMGYVLETFDNPDAVGLRLADLIDQNFSPDPFGHIQMSWAPIDEGVGIMYRFPLAALTYGQCLALGQFTIENHNKARAMNADELVSFIKDGKLK